MRRLHQNLLFLALGFIALLTGLVIYGAFIGARQASVFFNAPWAATYWIALVILLALGIPCFKRLLHTPPLLLMHLGCILILAGALWGSQKAFDWRHRQQPNSMARKGRIALFDGMRGNTLWIDANDHAPMPFDIALDRFEILYYEPGTLYVRSDANDAWKVPTETGAIYDLGPRFGTLTIERTYNNFKITRNEQGENVGYDDPNQGFNPAVECLITDPNGQILRAFVFERFRGHQPHPVLRFSYQRMVRDYISHIRIFQNNKPIARKSIEVNRPLHVKGYHIYQSSYGLDERSGRHYTVLEVVSDSGLHTIFVGYGLVTIGIFWQFWFRQLPRLSRQRHRIEPKQTEAA